MKKETKHADDALVRDEILHLPIGLIDPDPANPRVDVDADLAESIALHGVLQAIEVRPHPEHAERYMIVDGERRYRGSLAAKQRTIPATITFDAEGEGRADRLIRQIVRNEGKPLTAMEEALAFRAIIDDKHASGDTKYGPVQLARDLGIAKSTVGDRIALTELPACWLELMGPGGPLQPSHAAVLAPWKLLPEKFHQQAIAQMKHDYRWTQRRGASEKLHVDVLDALVSIFMKKFVKPVSECPGYTGPTNRFTLESYAGAKTYAMDPSQWRTLYAKARNAKKKKGGSSGSRGGDTAYKAQQEKWAQEQKAADAKRAAYKKAIPRIRAAMQAAVNALPDEETTAGGVLGDYVIDVTTHRYGAPKLKVPATAAPAQIIRAIAAHKLNETLSAEYNGARNFAPAAKALGLDLKALISGESAAAAPDPAPAKKGKRGKKAKAAELLACRYCGCTETTPCIDDETDTPCAWVDQSVPLCNNIACVEAHNADAAEAAGVDGIYDDAYLTGAPAGADANEFDDE